MISCQTMTNYRAYDLTFTNIECSGIKIGAGRKYKTNEDTKYNGYSRSGFSLICFH
jgi:hypothetical protein